MDVYIANFQKWDIVTPRYLDAQFFSQVDLDVYRLLDRWGLVKLLTIKEPVYPELVKVFNTNLRYKDEYVFYKVKGVKTNIDSGLFYELPGLSFDGEKLPNKGVAPKEWDLDYNHDTVLAMFVGDEDIPKGRKLVGKLSVANRVLHYTLVRALIFRGGNYAQITADDVLILWAMIFEHPVNWGYYAIQHMLKAKKQGKRALPYGMLMTIFFKHFRVPMTGEMTLAETFHFCINVASFSKMGFMKYGG